MAALNGSLANENIAGGRLYDAHIAEVARHAGAQMLVTDNLRHFGFIRRYGIEVLSAADFAAAANL